MTSNPDVSGNRAFSGEGQRDAEDFKSTEGMEVVVGTHSAVDPVATVTVHAATGITTEYVAGADLAAARSPVPPTLGWFASVTVTWQARHTDRMKK